MKSTKLPDCDGFITVSHKGKKKRNSRKPTPQDVFPQMQEPEAGNEVFDKRKFESALEDVKNSEFFMDFKENLLCSLKELNSNVASDREASLIKNIEALSINDSETLDIVCYGLGNFASSVAARYQFAFLILLKDIVSPRTISIYDPMFSNVERSSLEEFGLIVLDVNEVAKRTACSRTIFFMPHCDLSLYNNLLWANWNKNSLSNVILIGNSFQTYLLHRTEKFLKEKAVYVNYASKFVTEIRIFNNFKFLDIFNNSSLHFFHINALNKVPFEVWNDNTEPIHDDDDAIIKNIL